MKVVRVISPILLICFLCGCVTTRTDYSPAKVVSYRDVVQTKKGYKVEGIIVEETPDHITIGLEGGGTISIKRADVEYIRRAPKERVEELRQKWQEEDERAGREQDIQIEETKRKQRQENAFIKWCKEHSISVKHKEARRLRKISGQRKQKHPKTYCTTCDALGKIFCKECKGSGEVIVRCKRCDRGSIICSKCKGQGRLTCDYCKGKGGAIGICPDCSGSGSVVCYYCRGTGQIRCTVCRGRGMIKEYVYYDRRRRRWPWKRKEINRICPNCTGTGKVGCYVCNNSGIALCAACKGARERFLKCRICHGYGSKVCTACYGSGEEHCPTCAGFQMVKRTCRNCGREGFVLCQDCKGTGLLDKATEEQRIGTTGQE